MAIEEYSEHGIQNCAELLRSLTNSNIITPDQLDKVGVVLQTALFSFRNMYLCSYNKIFLPYVCIFMYASVMFSIT